MLRSLKDLEGYVLAAIDGDIGRVAGFYFDDEHWTIRHLVAQTGSTFHRRNALVSPISLGRADWESHRIQVSLTKETVKHAPGIDTDRPVSRQHERDYYRYYGLPYYWGYGSVWGMGGYPGLLAKSAFRQPPDDADDDASSDVHLRSSAEVRGYHIHGTDGDIGHVSDFIVDDESWEIRYLVVDTSNWWFGKRVLIAPRWANRVNWGERKVDLELTRAQIQASPAWNANAAINREYEARLFNYYGEPLYWVRSDPRPNHPAPTNNHVT